ncbi:MAG TPA: Na+/H+ antiporter NhaA [Caulobacteraceae bacterium]|jgi:NhaA family Na+:H+ antiporter|nr:Na+/H+ antiporter NhaA [Caulobacteraceae bacterium]
MYSTLGRLGRRLTNGPGAAATLIVSAAAALALANSPWSAGYFGLLHLPLAGLDLLHWINDALMAGFFLLVGLEIKRELRGGELGTWPRRVLPGVAALGGMAVPALIYTAVCWRAPELLRGWAVPTATDIAFALGVLSLMGSRVPASLKVFLAALAILDDLGAVLIIALVYTAGLSPVPLAGAAAVTAVLAAVNRAGVRSPWAYLALGVVLWALVMASGVHPTVAGVVLAMTVPHRAEPGRKSTLERLEHGLAPWVALGVLPLFAFANAGVALGPLGPGVLVEPAALGVALGLLAGKPLGVFGASVAVVGLGWAKRPAGAGARQLFGVAALCGIGFTMSLFIGALAFPVSPALQDAIKLGVLAGSIGSGLLGAAVLWRRSPPA